MDNNAAPLRFKRMSINSFISDLPNVINENFGKIVDFINSVYDFSKKKLHDITDIEASGTITANTVKAKNLVINGGITSDKLVIRIKDQTGNFVDIDLLELKNRIEALESKEPFIMYKEEE
jgi:hypothetical protein